MWSHQLLSSVSKPTSWAPCMQDVSESCSYSPALEVGHAQWCHQCPQESPTMAFRLMTDCQRSLFFYLVVTADSWFSWVCCLSLGSLRSAGKGTCCTVPFGEKLWDYISRRIPLCESEKETSPYLKSTSTNQHCPCCFSWWIWVSLLWKRNTQVNKHYCFTALSLRVYPKNQTCKVHFILPAAAYHQCTSADCWFAFPSEQPE